MTQRRSSPFEGAMLATNGRSMEFRGRSVGGNQLQHGEQWLERTSTLFLGRDQGRSIGPLGLHLLFQHFDSGGNHFELLFDGSDGDANGLGHVFDENITEFLKVELGQHCH